MSTAIRPWQPDDAPGLAAVISSRKIQDSLRDGIPYPYTAKDGAAFISGTLNAAPDSTFAFAVTSGGQLAGSIGAFRQQNVHRRTAELGYFIGEEYWGRGIGTAAVRLICRHIFENTDILRIYAAPFAHNAASCRVLEKAGFRWEGTLRCNAVKNGVVMDSKMYALIQERSGS